MIEAINLKKTFKRKKSKKEGKNTEIIAVNNINLDIKKGEIFGLIGPNGAGKTTTLKILSTLIIPDSGSVKINGYDALEKDDEVRSQIGLLTGEFTRSLYWRLSGLENMRFFARTRGIRKPEKRINELIEMFNLGEYKDELIMKYSTGMKHKIALAIGLIHDPPILFLDEPLTGIDPVTAFEIKKFIKNKLKDKTIIWASHNLFEIEEMCNKVALINNGKIILEGVPDELKKKFWSYNKIIIDADKPEYFGTLPNTTLKKDYVEFRSENIEKTIFEISRIARDNNIQIYDIKTLKPSLEEIFMEGIKKC